MTREDLAGVPDAGILKKLESGLEIIRRRKHEPIELSKLTRDDLIRLTGKRFGSKFLPDWTIVRLTAWTAEVVESHGWKTGAMQQLEVVLPESVGIVNGERVSTIRIICDGRHVHAFPIED